MVDKFFLGNTYIYPIPKNPKREGRLDMWLDQEGYIEDLFLDAIASLDMGYEREGVSKSMSLASQKINK